MDAADTPTVAGTRVCRFDTIGSTNAEALAAAQAGERGPLWITATQQSGGRGRRGRTWDSPPGNLYATLLIDTPCRPDRASELSFVAALALHDAVLALAPILTDQLQLKWPNDLLLDSAKLAGILAESESRPDGGFAVAIGFGVNCVSHPAATPYGATDLASAGLAIAPDDLLPNLNAGLEARLAEWDGGAGFDSIRSAWLLRAARIRQPIRLRTPDEIAGVFEGLDERGRLLLRSEDGRVQSFAAGDVHWAAGLGGDPRA
jgi:BirA family biotin operon repressor/biotin-[acetyl-CoA-carboxylase] ligase